MIRWVLTSLSRRLSTFHLQDTYHPDCLGPAYPKRPSRHNVWVCAKCVRCKSCGATTPGSGTDAVWTYDFSLCYECGQLMDKGELATFRCECMLLFGCQQHVYVNPLDGLPCLSWCRPMLLRGVQRISAPFGCSVWLLLLWSGPCHFDQTLVSSVRPYAYAHALLHALIHRLTRKNLY